MGTGGARVGSGPKPKRVDLDVVCGPPDETISKEPPGDLPADQRDFWVSCAPIAIERRTLTGQTVEAFRLLCELDAERRQTKRVLDASGRVYEKVWADAYGNEHTELKLHPLVNHYRQISKQQENMMLKFCLMPFGKPVTTTRTVGDRKRAAARTRFFGQDEQAKSA